MKPLKYNELTPQEKRKVREEYIAFQKGLCYFCKQDLTGKSGEPAFSAKINKRLFPENFFKFPVHLHHDHNTGYTLGAVHNQCNAYLWQYLGE